jgi:hypothetical protein
MENYLSEVVNTPLINTAVFIFCLLFVNDFLTINLNEVGSTVRIALLQIETIRKSHIQIKQTKQN